MPEETLQAIEWALQQTVTVEDDPNNPIAVTKETPHLLVDKVREWLNVNGVSYTAFSFNDLLPYLN